jgi:shikimate kinase
MNNQAGVKKLFRSRLPVYKKSADYTVDTDKSSAVEIAALIIKKAGEEA